MFVLEICANSFTSALAAQHGGAHRVELCANLAEGGTTPSYAQIKQCKTQLSMEVWPIVRPRGGDFLYTDIEYNLMKEDINICKSLNCDGIVIGILTANGEIDKQRCAELMELAKPMPVAFHRAFDMSNNLPKALEDLITLGIVRVLTSGAAASALAGTAMIEQLVKQANGRIEIMPGSGIHPENIKHIITSTGVKTAHASASAFVPSKMQFINTNSKMGQQTNEYIHQESSVELIKQLIANIPNPLRLS